MFCCLSLFASFSATDGISLPLSSVSGRDVHHSSSTTLDPRGQKKRFCFLFSSARNRSITGIPRCVPPALFRFRVIDKRHCRLHKNMYRGRDDTILILHLCLFETPGCVDECRSKNKLDPHNFWLTVKTKFVLKWIQVVL